MLSLAKFDQRAGRGGKPLPHVYSTLSFRNAAFRYGGTSMIAGKPGSLKTALALNLLVRWVRDHNLTALYFAADSDENTVARRISGIVTGRHQLTQVEPDFLAAMSGSKGRLEPYLPALGLMENVRFVYHSVELDEIAERVAAFEVLYGDYPNLVFIDNLINFATHPQDWDGMGAMLIEFNKMAQEFGNHFCVLHHASESWGVPETPMPSAAIQGKLNQIPRLIITTAKNDRQMAVCCVKNTNGPDDPAAQNPMIFSIRDSLAVVDDYRRETQ